MKSKLLTSLSLFFFYRNAGDDEIKKAYKKRALIHHPDRHANASESEKKDQEKKFKELSEAYGILSDPKKKARYDNGQDMDDFDGGMSGKKASSICIFCYVLYKFICFIFGNCVTFFQISTLHKCSSRSSVLADTDNSLDSAISPENFLSSSDKFLRYFGNKCTFRFFKIIYRLSRSLKHIGFPHYTYVLVFIVKLRYHMFFKCFILLGSVGEVLPTAPDILLFFLNNIFCTIEMLYEF